MCCCKIAGSPKGSITEVGKKNLSSPSHISVSQSQPAGKHHLTCLHSWQWQWARCQEDNFVFRKSHPHFNVLKENMVAADKTANNVNKQNRPFPSRVKILKPGWADAFQKTENVWTKTQQWLEELSQRTDKEKQRTNEWNSSVSQIYIIKPLNREWAISLRMTLVFSCRLSCT